MKKNSLKRQIEELERLIEANPNDPELHKDLGNIFYRSDALFFSFGRISYRSVYTSRLFLKLSIIWEMFIFS